jgi:EAL domain-containing protein (putative c-di-GMP-specific phosphodiesterase class I)
MAISNMQLALYENTSMTLQHAKSEKISYLIYNEHLKIEDSIISNLTWSSKIRNAIDENRIVPFYQPIYNNELEKIDRFEVLMRIIDEDGNVVSPMQFLPIAKKAGLYDKLTKLIIQKSFDYFEDKPFKFSINLSADDINNTRTRSYIYQHLNDFSRPENVIFEIVESESIENYDSMISFISEVKRFGAQIAIDDFGTGFSNFHYLFKLKVDSIKIDGTIIQQMQHDPSAELVAETIVSFANKMGISTVAEYVTDESIFYKIKKMGIGFAQGYFVAMPASDIVM